MLELALDQKGQGVLWDRYESLKQQADDQLKRFEITPGENDPVPGNVIGLQGAEFSCRKGFFM